MKRTIAWILGLVLALGAGIALGAWRVYEGTALLLYNGAVERDAVGIQRYVEVLEHMRADELEDAAEVLESWLDDTLILVMEPSNYEYGLEPRVVARADTAFQAARAYREAFPRTSDRSFVDEMIANVWAGGPPSQFPEDPR